MRIGICTNVGADTETEYGEYFSWGDTIGQNKNGYGSYSFSEDNYNAGLCGSGHNLTGDIPQGNATYDAATANMGSPWKIPTKEQCQELIDGTNSTWTTINGVNGRKFTSKKNSTKYIFLPASGRWEDISYPNAGSTAFYLCVTHSGSNAASSIYLGSTFTMIEMTSRFVGNSVRAIQ